MSQTQAQASPGSPISEAETERLARIAGDIIRGRTDLASAVGISAGELEAVYSLAHGHYTAGKYDEAEDMFRFLCMNRHMEPRFWLGLGACQQMQKKTAQAVKSYGLGALLAPTDPQMSLRAGECFVALGDTGAARTALEAAVLAAEGDDAKAPYARRAQVILDSLNGRAAR